MMLVYRLLLTIKCFHDNLVLLNLDDAGKAVGTIVTIVTYTTLFRVAIASEMLKTKKELIIVLTINKLQSYKDKANKVSKY